MAQRLVARALSLSSISLKALVRPISTTVMLKHNGGPIGRRGAFLSAGEFGSDLAGEHRQIGARWRAEAEYDENEGVDHDEVASSF